MYRGKYSVGTRFFWGKTVLSEHLIRLSGHIVRKRQGRTKMTDVKHWRVPTLLLRG